MNYREDSRSHEHAERGREANGGRDYYPGSHRDQQYRDQQHREQQRRGQQYGFGQRTHWVEPQPLYGRQQPFGPAEETPYYGTGSANYGGPGFTGGAYAYGNGPRDEMRPIEDEYSDESAVSYEHAPHQPYGEHQYGQRQYAQRPYGPQNRQQYGQYGQYGQPPYGGDRYAGNPGLRTRRFTTGPKGYQRSDERLKEDISERLMESHYIDSSDVSLDVRGARVVLEGTVPSRYMKHAIEDLVDGCPGVLDIDNRVRVANPLMRQGTGTPGQGLTGSSATGTAGGVGTGGTKKV